MATEDDVRKAALALPGVTERPSWGQPAWFAKTLMARIWEPGVLTVKTEEREALAGTEPETYFWTPHHDRSSQLVLVRLDRIDAELLEELLQDSYRLAGGERSSRLQPGNH
ncbi:MmcQ/YjbR family DNA-binding protein [Arthrobacter sp. D3-16]